MSTTETLRTQLDVLQVKQNDLLAENRKLRNEYPDQARVADLEGELAETQEENVRLSQAVAQLEATCDKARDEAAEREREHRTMVETMTRDATRLRERLTKEEGQRGKAEERVAELKRSMEEARAKVVEMKGYCHDLERKQERIQADGELQTFWAVAKEMRKWEEREARRVGRVE